MTDQQKEKVTSSKIIEEQEKLKAKYETEKEALEQQNTELQNIITKKNDEIFELQKENKRTAEERDDWKQEAHAARKVHQDTKQQKETTDFLTELAKLQQKKGININTNE